MPAPYSWSSATSVPLPGVLTTDALLKGVKWASGAITYSFPTYGALWSTNNTTGYGPSTGSGEPWNTLFTPLNAGQQAYFTDALQTWANVANVTFTLVTESSTNVGDIRAAFTDTPDAQAWAYGPGNSAFSGDVWFGQKGTSARYDWTPGSYRYVTAIHEIGHVLGLKHDFATFDTNTQVLPTSLDTGSYTVMSYSAKAGDNTTFFSFEPTTPMILDIRAIQYLYGANYSYHAGDDTYLFTDDTPYHQTIWDGGGNDTIHYSGVWGSNIDIRANYGSVLGLPVYVYSSTGEILFDVDNIWIASGVTIENAIGGAGNDVITGNDADNILQGGAGNDDIAGGLGDDVFDWNVAHRDGNDTFYGGVGDDIYFFDSAQDTAIENAGEGFDAVTVSFSYSLVNLPNVEALLAYGATGLTLVGNWIDNLIGGTAGNDDIDGGVGDDIVIFSGPRSDYSIAAISGGFTVSSTADGMDTLRNVEHLLFKDQVVTLLSADITPPLAIAFSPAGGSTNVAVSSDIVVTFNEAVVRGVGTIVLKDATGVTVEAFNAATSTRLSISGSTLTVNPTADLGPNIQYSLELAPGTIKDLASNNYAGTTTYIFKTTSVASPDHASTAVCILNRAFNDVSPSNAVFVDQVAQATQDESGFALNFGKHYDSLSDATLAAKVMANMGLLPNTALQDVLTGYFAANAGGRGLVVLQLGTILTALSNPSTAELAPYVPQASAWNAELTAAFAYSSDTSHTTPAESENAVALVGFQSLDMEI